MDLDPRAIQVCCDDDNLGRYLITTKSIKTGTVILKETPLVKGPFLHTNPVCLGCYQLIDETNYQRCSACGWPVCNANCANNHDHQAECRFTAAKGDKIFIKNFGIPHPNYQSITILRCLNLRDTAPELWKKLMDLQSNPSDEDVRIAAFVKRFFKLNTYSTDDILKICGILKINGHEVPVTDPPYLAIYGTASLFEHSCRSNCSKTFTDNGQILITAAHDIDADEHLSICYTDPVWNREYRQNHLYETKNFWCQCERCSDFTEFGTNYNSIKCQKLNCDGVMLPKTQASDWCCNKCNEVISTGMIDEILGKILDNFDKTPKTSPLLMGNFIKSSGKFLPPTHYLLVEAKLALLQILNNNPDYRHELIAELLEIVEKLMPAEKRLKALLLYHKAQTIDQKSQEFKNIAGKCCELLKNEPKALPEYGIYQKLQKQLQNP